MKKTIGTKFILLIPVFVAVMVAAFYLGNFADFEKEEVKSIVEQESATETSTETEEIISETDSEELSFEEKVWQERIDAAFEPADCQPAADRRFGSLYYDGPLIDGHYHIASIPDSSPYEGDSWRANIDNNFPSLGVNVKMTDIVCSMEQGDVDAAFAFFPVYKEEIRDHHVELARRTMELYPDKFIPFIMPPDSDNSIGGSPTVNAKVLEEMLEVEPGLFVGYGEIGLYARQGGSDDLPPDSQRLQDIYPVLRKNNVVVYFHLGVGHKDNIEKVAAANPDINFIFHGDQLVKYEDGGQNLEDIEDILYNHPNVYYEVDELYGDVWLLRPEVSRGAFLAHFDDYEELLEKDLGTWEGFIERHPDQVLWGTDRGAIAVWSVDEEVGMTLTNYARAFIAHLDPDVQERYAYKNVEKIFGRSFTS